MECRRAASLFTLALAGIVCIPPLHAEFFRWVDEGGKVHYSDRVPPLHSHRERHVYDDEGRLKRTIHAAKTKEQLEEEKRQMELEERKRNKKEAQRRYDRMLLGTFGSIGELETTRDQRLAIIVTEIQITEDKLAVLRDKLSELESIIEAAQGDGGKASRRMLNQAEATRRKIERTQGHLTAKQKQKKSTEEVFAADINRFRELKNSHASRHRPLGSLHPPVSP